MKSALDTTPEPVVLPASVGMIADADFRTAMRQVASSVAVITARSGEMRNGLTATAVCSVSASPPTMLVCVNKAATADQLIAASGAFAINYLAENQHQIARLFSTAKLDAEARFGEGVWLGLETGSPILAGTAASFDCRVQSRISMSTHHIYLGSVVAVASLDEAPLLYRDGNFRRLQPV
jgi:flavin reductase